MTPTLSQPASHALEGVPGAPRAEGGQHKPSSWSNEGWAKVIARRYHFSVASFAYAATTCVLVIGAVNGQNNLLFWIFGLSVAGLLLSGVISGWSLMGLRVRRRVLGPVAAGEEFEVEYEVRNSNYLFGAFALLLEELSEGRGWLGKRFGSSWATHVVTPRAFVAYVGPRRSVVVRCRVLALRRGEATFHALRASSTFPFGITRKSVTFVQESAMLVHPQRVELAAALAVLGGDERHEQRQFVRARTGDETIALRDYAPGDEPRAIAWRASARLDRPVVREKAQRRGRRVWIVLDDAPHLSDSLPGDVGIGGARPDGDEHRERAIAVASAMLDRAGRRGDQVGLLSASAGTLLVPLAGARGGAHDILARHKPSANTDSWEGGAASGLHHLQAGDGLVVVPTSSTQVSAWASALLGQHGSGMGGGLGGGGTHVVVDAGAPATYRSGELPEVPALPEAPRALSWLVKLLDAARDLVVAQSSNGSGASGGSPARGGHA